MIQFCILCLQLTVSRIVAVKVIVGIGASNKTNIQKRILQIENLRIAKQTGWSYGINVCSPTISYNQELLRRRILFKTISTIISIMRK